MVVMRAGRYSALYIVALLLATVLWTVAGHRVDLNNLAHAGTEESTEMETAPLGDAGDIKTEEDLKAVYDSAVADIQAGEPNPERALQKLDSIIPYLPVVEANYVFLGMVYHNKAISMAQMGTYKNTDVLAANAFSLWLFPLNAEAWCTLGLVHSEEYADEDTKLLTMEASVALKPFEQNLYQAGMAMSHGSVSLRGAAYLEELARLFPQWAGEEGVYHAIGGQYHSKGMWAQSLRNMNTQLTYRDDPAVHNVITMINLETMNFTTRADDYANVRSAFERQERHDAISPFNILFVYEFTEEEVLVVAQRSCESMVPVGAEQTFLTEFVMPSIHTYGTLRIGFLSKNLNYHPMAITITNMLYLISSTPGVETHIICRNMDDNSFYRANLAALPNFSTQLGSDLTVAQYINSKQIMILMNPDGHMCDSCIRTLAYRPSPVSVGMQGDPASSGCNFVDYFLNDPIAAPPEYSHLFMEKLCYFPADSAMSYHLTEMGIGMVNEAPVLGRPSPQDAEKVAGLNYKYFTFCSFNRYGKITEDLFDVWIRILKRVPNSVMWFSMPGTSSLVQQNIFLEAKKRGLEQPQRRFRFASLFPISTHRHVKAACDLYLDSPYHGSHGTGVDVLWAGIPMIVMAKRKWTASRIPLSLLNAIGLSETIVRNFWEYEELAVSLAEVHTVNPESRINRLRAKLNRSRFLGNLFQTRLWVEFFTRQLRAMWEQYAQRPQEADSQYNIRRWKAHVVAVPPNRMLPTETNLDRYYNANREL